MKRTYISPSLYSKRIASNHLMLNCSVEADPSGKHDEGGGNTFINAKQGTGFDWGDSWSNNEESEN